MGSTNDNDNDDYHQHHMNHHSRMTRESTYPTTKTPDISILQASSKENREKKRRHVRSLSFFGGVNSYLACRKHKKIGPLGRSILKRD